MNKGRVAAAVGTALLAMCASAQTLTVEGTPRNRWGVGLDVGGDATVFQAVAGAGSTTKTTGIGAAPGLSLRAGLQRDDVLGMDLEVAAGWLLLSGYARVAWFGTFTWRDKLTVGLGPVLGMGYLGFFPFPGDMPSGVATGTWSWGGGTARVEFHLRRSREPDGRRQSMTLSVVGEAGVALGSNGFAGSGPAGGVHLVLGHSWY